MRFTIITAIAAISSVYAVPHFEERGTYEMADVISVGVNYPAPENTPQAQYEPPSAPTSAPPPPPPAQPETPTAVASAAVPCRTQYVIVGGQAGLVYTPEFIFAEIGEVIIFHFNTKNHTLTQSTFPQPCAAMPGGTHLMWII